MMATLKEVARAAGVSTVTASSVLSGVNRVRVAAATVARIRETARSLNYVPFAAARGLRTGRTHAIAFVTAATTSPYRDDPWQESLRGISDLLCEHSQRLMIGMPRDTEHELEMIRQFAFGRQVDGIILQGGMPGDPRIELLRESARPFVLLGGVADGCPATLLDLRPAAKAIYERLAADHSTVAVIAPRPETPSVRDFLAGCADGAAASGRPLREWTRSFLPGAEWWREAAAGKPLGVILYRALLPELCAALHRSHLTLGADVSVAYLAIGDDVILPPRGLAVVRLDHYTVGRRAAQLLFQWIEKKDSFQTDTSLRVPALPL